MRARTGRDTANFIVIDPLKHDEQRKIVQSVVAPQNLANLEPLARYKVETKLDSLPIDETFNSIDKAFIELKTQMLATLLNFPFEDRNLLAYWLDVATSGPATAIGVEGMTGRSA